MARSTWESGEGAATRLFFFCSITGRISRPPEQSINPQRKLSVGPCWAEADSKGGVATEGALHKFQVLKSPRLCNARAGAEGKPHHVPRSRENREQLSACARPLRLRLSFSPPPPLSSLSYFLNHHSSTQPPLHFLPPPPSSFAPAAESRHIFLQKYYQSSTQGITGIS